MGVGEGQSKDRKAKEAQIRNAFDRCSASAHPAMSGFLINTSSFSNL